MGKCAICEEKVDKFILYMPSNVAVFLCQRHLNMRINEKSPLPICDWVDSQKELEELKKILTGKTNNEGK